MEEFDYRGYTIIKTDDNYFTIDDYEFTSFDEACDWIDAKLEEEYDYADAYDEDVKIAAEPEVHTYHIFYVPKGVDQGYDDFIQAHSEKEARKILRNRERDIDYITDCYPID